MSGAEGRLWRRMKGRNCKKSISKREEIGAGYRGWRNDEDGSPTGHVGVLKREVWRSPTAWLDNTTYQNLRRRVPAFFQGGSHASGLGGCGWNVPVSAILCHGWLVQMTETDILIKLFDPMSIEQSICPMNIWPHSWRMLHTYRVFNPRSPLTVQTKNDIFLGIGQMRPPLWSRGQSSWLQTQRFDSRCCQIFWEVVGLERGPLSLVSTIEELLGRNSSGSSLENWEYGHGDPLCWPRDTLYPQKLALTAPTSGGRSVGTVLLRA
jgi:hypothetical protein